MTSSLLGDLEGAIARYEAAVVGFRGYWYPAIKSHDVRGKPVQVQLLGEKIMLKRERGRVFALHDRCPHRGVPLSHAMATQEFPGTWSCCYHGWTFDLETGKLVAAITDGPESPIAGKCNVRTYPVEERLGMVWLYHGDDDPPPPVETAGDCYALPLLQIREIVPLPPLSKVPCRPIPRP